ncbi:MAG: ATP-binding protein [Methanosarcinales archaeon]|nr:ATP-binding protein [Methanosarcinales archaeon]MCD4808885.1 ATP-binding protein [Methanosarcinales archaeon]
MTKKEMFKYIIKEFHEARLPELYERKLTIPETQKVISLIGLRRAGKTFYFYQLINNLIEGSINPSQILYINFEDDRILPLNVKELNTILEAYYELYPENIDETLYLFFDEIQNIDNWELFIRRVHDRKNARIFITGSSSKLLSKEIATSLRGRTLSYYLFPLSFEEFLRFRQVTLNKDFEYTDARFRVKKLFSEYLYGGGFPEVVLEAEELRQDILRNYFEMFIYRDLVERFSIRNTSLLKSLVKFLITNIGTTFSVNSFYRTIRKDMPVGKDTLMEYLSYLEDINLVYLVPIFSYSLKKQQVNPRKVYCIDNGLRNAVSFMFSKDEGRLAENLVFLELKRRNKEPYYWKNKGEVDFVIKDRDSSLTAINVSYTDEIDERETKALLEFADEFSSKVKELILLTKDLEKTEGRIKIIPLWKWLIH